MSRGLNNVVDLDDIDEGQIGKKPENPVKLVKGAPPKEEDFTDLSDLKNLKISRETTEESVIQDDVKIDNLDEAIARQMFVIETLAEEFTELEEAENRIEGISVDNGEGDEEQDDSDFEDDTEQDVEEEVEEDTDIAEEPEADFDGELTDDEEAELEEARRLKRAEDNGVKIGHASKTANTNTMKGKGGKVQKKTQARIQGNLARLRNAINMAGAYHDIYFPKSNLVFRAYKPNNSIALDNRTIQGDWIRAGRDRLRATLKEFYENGALRCAENVSFEVFLRSVSYRDLKYLNCGVASTVVDKWEMDIGLCKHVDADGACTKSDKPEVITLPIKDIVQKSYTADELDRLSRYDNTRSIEDLHSETLFGKCEVYTVDIANGNGDKTGTMNVYTSEASIERFLSVMRAVDDYLINVLVDERPDMRAIAGNLSTEELLYQVKEIMPEKSSEAYGVAIVMLGIDRLEVGAVGEEKVVEFKVEDVKSYEELFELFSLIDSRIMAKLGDDEKQQEMAGIATFRIRYKRKCGHVTPVVISSELVLNLPRRVLSV